MIDLLDPLSEFARYEGKGVKINPNFYHSLNNTPNLLDCIQLGNLSMVRVSFTIRFQSIIVVNSSPFFY